MLVKCDECGKVHLFKNWLHVDSYDLDEREMGVEVGHVFQASAECPCGNEMTITGEGYEYPMDAPIDDIEVIEYYGCEILEGDYKPDYIHEYPIEAHDDEEELDYEYE